MGNVLYKGPWLDLSRRGWTGWELQGGKPIRIKLPRHLLPYDDVQMWRWCYDNLQGDSHVARLRDTTSVYCQFASDAACVEARFGWITRASTVLLPPDQRFGAVFDWCEAELQHRYHLLNFTAPITVVCEDETDAALVRMVLG
jgi:hypothetical protein